MSNLQRLFLLRHADASPATAGQLDFDRKLSEKGQREAAKIGEIFKQNYHSPDCALLSPSMRTKETADYSNIVKKADLIYVDAIYEGITKDYLDEIRNYDHFSSLLLIGHNPTIFALLHTLVTPHSKAKIPNSYPTAGLAVIDFPDPNLNLADHSGQLIDFYYP